MSVKTRLRRKIDHASKSQTKPNIPEVLLGEASFVRASVISSRLSYLKNRVIQEKDPQKQLALIAQMIHFGIGTIALVLDKK